ncbi:MAG: TIGR01620 family protein, partial [Planktomarina sp.]
LTALYRGRADMKWSVDRYTEVRGDILDADGLLGSAEHTILAPLDAAALLQVERAARQVATVTALAPIALVDVFTALTANLRMIRVIAEIYGGRSGTIGSWRLARSVLAHLVATGAVAIGDDLIGSVAGGSVLSKVSRRFGEGVINGALTARVGIAAMEVCRPMAFRATKKPSVAGVMKRSVTGLFQS